MALYYFRCGGCDKELRKFFDNLQQASQPLTCECGQVFVRDPHPPSSQVMETLDNTMMVRRLERHADAERLSKERAAAHKKKLEE